MEFVNLLMNLAEDKINLITAFSLMFIAYSTIKSSSVPSVKNIKKKIEREQSAFLSWSFHRQEEDCDYFSNKKESSPLRDFYRRTSFDPKWENYISEWEWDEERRDCVKVYDNETKTYYPDRNIWWCDVREEKKHHV
jgi:hypothetical protein